MYDHSPQSSTTKVHRQNSGSKSHLSSLMPLHHHSHHSSRSPYQPNSRQADISRLLDPAYASSSTASAHSSSTNVRACTRAYVDHTGEMHDPDYRDFPVLSPRQPPKNVNTPRRALSAHSRISSSTSTSSRPDRYKTYPLVARPEWERGWATEAEDLDEEDEELSSHEGGVRSPFSSSSSDRTPSSRRASLPPSVYTYTPSTYYFSEPASTTSSPVDSLEEEQDLDAAEQSPFEDAVEEEERTPGSTSRTAASILRKMKRTSSGSTVPVVPPRPSRADGEDKESPEAFLMRDDDEVYVYAPSCSMSRPTLTSILYSPSCTHIFSRKLRAFNLRLRFGVFHAKRRLSISRRKNSSSVVD